VTIDPPTPGDRDSVGEHGAASDQPRDADFRELAERLERRDARIDNWTVGVFGLAAIALVASVVAIGLGVRAIDQSGSNTPAASGGTPAASATAPTESATCPSDDDLIGQVADHGAKSAAGPTVAVVADDFFFQPTCTTRVSAGTITLTVHNVGGALHNISVPDQSIDTDVPPGATMTVQVKLGNSAVPFFCKYHRGSGMVGSLLPAGP
jgi:plastocyanin